jgi:hypothetical protein
MGYRTRPPARRVDLAAILSRAYLAIAVLVTGALGILSVHPAGADRFLSQIKDRSALGWGVMLLIMAAGAIAGWCAVERRSWGAAALRAAMTALMAVLLATRAHADIHLLAFAVLLILLFVISGQSVGRLLAARRDGLGLALGFGLLCGLLASWSMCPIVQKGLIVLFLWIEYGALRIAAGGIAPAAAREAVRPFRHGVSTGIPGRALPVAVRVRSAQRPMARPWRGRGG